MRFHVLCLFILFIPVILFAQPYHLWTQQYDGGEHEALSSMVETSDGGYLLAGGKGNEQRNPDLYIVKTDYNGIELWSKIYEPLYRAYQLIPDKDGGVQLLVSHTVHPNRIVPRQQGVVTDYIPSYQQLLAIKLDSSGRKTDMLELKTDSIQRISEFIGTSDGGFLVTGITSSTTSRSKSGFVAQKYDKYGNIQWLQTWFAADTIAANQTLQTPDRGFLVLAKIRSGSYRHRNKELVIKKINSLGDPQWIKVHKMNLAVNFHMTTLAGDSGFYIYATEYGKYGASDRGGCVLKLDANGNWLWKKELTSSTSEKYNAMILAPDGGILLAGSVYTKSDYYRDGRLRQKHNSNTLLTYINPDGEDKWIKQIGSDWYDESSDIIVTHNNGVAVGLRRHHQERYNPDLGLMMFGPLVD